jgi:predicted nucleic acid-binding protein
VTRKMTNLLPVPWKANAGYLVTGDSDLLDMESYQDVIMIRAYDFVEMLDNQV